MREHSARAGRLILGGGFAGAYVARLVGRAGATIVSTENFMLYTPILPEAASGTLEPRHVVVPIRVMCPHAELLLGRVTGLDEDARIVSLETEAGAATVAYEQLVVALGAVTRTLPVPGLAEHALLYKSLEDAIR
jgi:NADH dehydrogenase